MKDSSKLAKYIHEEIVDLRWGSRGQLFNKLTPNAIKCWIQQFQLRKCVGHSEWSERYQRNIWVSDYEEE